MARSKTIRRKVQPGWHPEDVKAAIRKSGTTVSALATLNGLSESALRQAMRRPEGVPAADDVIADFLGLPKHALWPHRYDKEDQPLNPRRKSRFADNRIARLAASHRQSEAAS